MKKNLLLLALLFSTTILAKKKVSGYIITDENDTIKVTFKIPVNFIRGEPNFERLQWRVKYYDSLGVKKILRPTMVKAIVFKYDEKTFKMLTCSDNLGVVKSLFSKQQDFFFHVISEGKLKLLKVYRTYSYRGGMSPSGTRTYSSTHTDEKYVFKKNNGELFRPHLFSFKSDMTAYLSDCPDVANKITNKEYRRSDIEQIVSEYNRICGN